MNIAWILLPAILLEALFYFLPSSTGFRSRFGKLSPYLQAPLIWLSGFAPVFLLNQLQGSHPEEFTLFAGALGITCVWFLILPKRPAADILLLVLLSSFILLPWFKPLFPSPAGTAKLDSLNKLLWVRVGIWVFLFPRRFSVPGIGFLPNRQEWFVGTRYFVYFLAIILPVGLYFHIFRVQFPKVDLWAIPFLTLGTFLGMMLFVTWGEEFLVRGVLQSVLIKELGRWPGILIASLCFGLVHLSFRNYPNWRFAAFSALAAVFYGLAFERGHSLRAAMVTHSLVNTVWTIVFSRSL
ncbi:CPBP family intramembrane glutamic endopeptidase [Bryobacter aggregatus]|uniref:CPBP family intramembrane glutamic endopeptidase n=1 Tax=Bryobacter aggregatus TaxID=360054 RepID=UPI0004E158F3|nr:type II CAAX endopeptidase family protein [Bryobacter aggregatus]